MTLSLQEYNKFLQVPRLTHSIFRSFEPLIPVMKDCKIHDAKLSPSITDSIYRAVLMHGPSGSVPKGNQPGTQRYMDKDFCSQFVFNN